VYGVVEEVVRLTPSMVRVVLGGEGLDEFEPAPFTDQYVNALFVPDGAPYPVPFDVEAARSSGHRPVGRRYTIRRWDPATRQVTIDFVVHGDIGFAGRWANHAAVGDRLQMVGPTGGYSPSTTADWHLMVGDESALPAICASLEQVRPGIPTLVVVVVDGPDHELELGSAEPSATTPSTTRTPRAPTCRWARPSTSRSPSPTASPPRPGRGLTSG